MRPRISRNVPAGIFAGLLEKSRIVCVEAEQLRGEVFSVSFSILSSMLCLPARSEMKTVSFWPALSWISRRSPVSGLAAFTQMTPQMP